MKLTNISLAVLVALGLVACGGSDDNNNQTTDPKPPKEIPSDGGNGGDGGTPPKGDKSGLVPERQAPDLTVAKDLETIVASRKRIYVDRNFVDTALGYENGFDYNEKVGTDPADVKLTSTYKFLAEDDVITKAIGNYKDTAIGAIFVGDNPAAFTNNAFVKTKDGYVRVATDGVEAANFTPDTPFYAVNDTGAAVDASKKYSQKEVVFIANVIADASKGKKGSEIELGDDTSDYDPKANEVRLQNIKVFDQEYSATSRSQTLDFGQMKVMRGIQSADITGVYEISNGKQTATGDDNFSMTKNIKIGGVKAYNLPYSIALVTTNIDKDVPSEKDIFNLGKNGSFQVAGFQTIALPKDGRAIYNGESFSAKSTGEVRLVADFFADRAGVSGTIFNRKDHKGKELGDLTLENITLTTPEKHDTSKSDGVVKGQPSYADKWSVTFYGPEAEEAAGKIMKGDEVKEVYNTQRGPLTNRSNDAGVQ